MIKPDDYPEIVRPLLEIVGPLRLEEEGVKILGYPVLMVTDFREVRKLIERMV